MIKVNLLPKIDIHVEADKGFPLWYLVLVVVVCGFVAGFLFLQVNNRQRFLESKISEVDLQLADYDAEINANANAKREHAQLQQQYRFVSSVKATQTRWADFLDALKANTPKDVWYQGLDASRSDNKYQIDCRTFSAASVGNTMLKFHRILFFQSVNFTGTAASGEHAGKPIQNFFLDGAFDLVAQPRPQAAVQSEADPQAPQSMSPAAEGRGE